MLCAYRFAPAGSQSIKMDRPLHGLLTRTQQAWSLLVSELISPINAGLLWETLFSETIREQAEHKNRLTEPQRVPPFTSFIYAENVRLRLTRKCPSAVSTHHILVSCRANRIWVRPHPPSRTKAHGGETLACACCLPLPPLHVDRQTSDSKICRSWNKGAENIV